MRKLETLAKWAKGRVYGHFVNPCTGEKKGFFDTHNVITYTGADIMARLLGGDTTFIPKHIGFIYGTSATPTLADPDSPVVRNSSWAQIALQLNVSQIGAGLGNILISPLTTSPSYSIDGSTALYTGNAVTVSANSGSRLEYGFDTNGTTYAEAIKDDGTSDYMYQAVLLTRIVTNTTTTYYPFARVSLADTSVYLVKPANWELSVYWQISFM